MSAGKYYIIDQCGELSGPYKTKADAINKARQEVKELWTTSCGCLRGKETHDDWELPITILQAIGSYTPEFNISVRMKEVKP